ncbi:MAG: hypothetical protein ACREI2_13360 [Nitrospiraceae bacterium]
MAVEELRRTVLSCPGATNPKLREAAFAGREVPPPLGGYLVKVRDYSFRVSEEDIAMLRDSGFT